MHLQWADTEYLDGQFTSAQTRFEQLFAAAASAEARAGILVRQAEVTAAVNQRRDACDILRHAAGLLGLHLRARPSIPDLLFALLRVRRRLQKIDWDALPHLPAAQSQHAIVLADALRSLHDQAFFSGQHELSGIAGLHLMILTLEHGRTKRMSLAVAAAAMILIAALKDLTLANRLEKVFRIMAESTGIEADAGYVGMACMVTHLQVKPRALVSEAATLAEEAWQNGAHFYASILDSYSRSLLNYIDLDAASVIGDRTLQAAIRRGDQINISLQRSTRQYARCMAGETAGPASFSDEHYDEHSAFHTMESTGQQVALAGFYTCKLTCALVHGEYAIAGAVEDNIFRINAIRLMGGESSYATALTAMGAFVAQTQLAFAQKKSRVGKPRQLRYWLKLGRWFAAHSPAIYGGFPLLFDAELAALRGAVDVAIHLYDQALPLLEESGYRYYAAIGFECAGRFYLRIGATRSAAVHLQRARDIYRAWGAKRKLGLMAREFPVYLETTANVAATHEITAATRESDSPEQAHETVATLQAIEEIGLATDGDAVAQALLRGILAAVGGTRVVLVAFEANTLYVRAVQHPGDAAPTLLMEPASMSTWVPSRVLQYSVNTMQTIGLDGGDGNPLWEDTYFNEHRSQSVLCVPIERRNRLFGLLYIENGMVRGAFRSAKALVRVLCAQTAVALEMLSLQKDLERRAQERAQIIQSAQASQAYKDTVTVEERLAGGFAHEMRNALSAARTLVEHALRSGTDADKSPADTAANALLRILTLVEPHLQAADMATLRSSLDVVVAYLESSAEALIGIDHATARAMRIVSLIVDYARLGEEKRGGEHVEIDVVLARLTSDMQGDFAREHIDLQFESVSHAIAVGKEDHFYAIFSNLLINARHALMGVEDARERRVKVSLSQREAGVRVSISDNGIGMSAEILAKLGAPFFTTKGTRGTGLGIGTVKKLVALYDGKIEIDSVPNEGSTFTIDI